MKKLIFVLLAFLAVFTYIRALPNAESVENGQETGSKAQTPLIMGTLPQIIPVEITQ